MYIVEPQLLVLKVVYNQISHQTDILDTASRFEIVQRSFLDN